MYGVQLSLLIFFCPAYTSPKKEKIQAVAWISINKSTHQEENVEGEGQEGVGEKWGEGEIARSLLGHAAWLVLKEAALTN